MPLRLATRTQLSAVLSRLGTTQRSLYTSPEPASPMTAELREEVRILRIALREALSILIKEAE